MVYSEICVLHEQFWQTYYVLNIFKYLSIYGQSYPIKRWFGFFFEEYLGTIVSAYICRKYPG